VNIDALVANAPAFETELAALKASLEPASFWYPYGSITNVVHLSRLLTDSHRDLGALAAGRAVVDIGAADGDMAFFLERNGFVTEIVDHGPTNWNGLRGARRLQEALGSAVVIHDVDLDAQFRLPRSDYGLVLFLGILYHLQNPFYALKALAAASAYCLVSTRIAQVTVDRKTRLDNAPVAYLVSPTETNNDATNYWIFSYPGLQRLCDRTGWDIVDTIRLGATKDSDPASPDRDERAFLLLKSRITG
jgi:hypothetical protein